MATRFYLPATGTAAVSPTPSTSWTVSTGAGFLPAVITKGNTALANGTARVTAVASAYRNVCDNIFVSDPITAQTIAVGTFSAVIKAIESTSTANGWLQVIIRVISGDGTVERGVIYAGSTTAVTPVTTVGAENEEYPITTAATRIKNAIATTAVTAVDGDRICIEIGSRYNAAATNSTFTLRYGDPSATGDFALTSGLTTDLCPWVELSQTLTFATPPTSTWQQSWTPVTANATTGTSAGLTTTTGNLIVVAHVGNAAGTGGESCTDSKGNTYTLLTSALWNGNSTAIWYCFNIAGGASHTITVGCATGGNLVNFVAQEFGGIATASAFETSSTVATPLTASPISNSITTTNATDTLVGILMTSATGAVTAGGGFSNVSASATAQAARRVAMESETVAATGTYTAGWSAVGATTSAAYILAFKNAGAAGPPRELLMIPRNQSVIRSSVW